MVERTIMDSFRTSAKTNYEPGRFSNKVRDSLSVEDSVNHRLLFAALRYLAMEAINSPEPNVALLAKGKIKLSYNQAADGVVVSLFSGERGCALGKAVFTARKITTEHKRFMDIRMVFDGGKRPWYEYPSIISKMNDVKEDPAKAEALAQEASRINALAHKRVKDKQRLCERLQEPRWKSALRRVLKHTL